MKKLVYPSVFLILFSTACSKNSNSSTAPVSATFSGKTFAAANSQGFYSHSQHIFLMAGYTINGGDTTAIEFQLSSNVTLGTPVSFTDGQTVEYYDTKNNFDYSGDQTTGHGTVTINTWDSVNYKVTGTFTGVLQSNFAAGDTLVVTNGQFDFKYTLEP